MRAVDAHEAENHFSRLLDEVAKGETITITRPGMPVARLVPPLETQSLSVAEAIAGIRELWKSVRPLDGLSIREMIEEGRRY